MKYLKMLGLAAVAACALLAVVGVGAASATTLTCAEKTPDGTHHELKLCSNTQILHAVSVGKAVLDAPFGNIECNSTTHGTITNPGSASTTASGPIPKGGLIFNECGSDTVTVLKEGSLEIHTDVEGVTDFNGTVTSIGAEVTIVHLGFHCIFGTGAGTDIGTLTGSTTTGKTATMHIKATIPRTGGSSGAFCGSSAPWTGTYDITTPDTLDVH